MLNAAHPASRLPPPAPNSLFAPARALLYTPHLPRRHRRRRRRVNPPLHLRGPRTSRFSTYFIRHHGRSTSPPSADGDARCSAFKHLRDGRRLQLWVFLAERRLR